MPGGSGELEAGELEGGELEAGELEAGELEGVRHIAGSSRGKGDAEACGGPRELEGAGVAEEYDASDFASDGLSRGERGDGDCLGVGRGPAHDYGVEGVSVGGEANGARGVAVAGDASAAD